MNILDQIKEIVKLAFKSEKIYSEVCTIVSVNESERTCICQPIDDSAELQKVRLQAIKSQSVGLVQIPKVGSYVIVTFIDNKNSFVSVFTEIDKILIDTDLVQFNGGTFDGIVKINDLVTKLNNLENDINDLKTAFSSWVTVPNDGGAALKAITATWYAATLTPTVKNDLEDTKITH